MNRIAFLLLMVCNFIWALNPLMGKVLLESQGVSEGGVQVAWLRYASGFAAFFAIALVRVVVFRRSWAEFFFVPKDWRTARDLVILGVGPFVVAPIFQFVGLETALAMDNSILIATEPLITVALAWAILGEKMKREHQISMGVALLGFFLYSGIFTLGIGALSVGMFFLLFAQVGEGTYSVFARKLVAEHSPQAILGSALVIGALLLTVSVLSFAHLPDLGAFETKQWSALVWLGPVGSTATYLIWAMVARNVSVASMAITLFVQPVIGALVGYFYLGERLTVERCFGAILILVAIGFLAAQEARSGPLPLKASS